VLFLPLVVSFGLADGLSHYFPCTDFLVRRRGGLRDGMSIGREDLCMFGNVFNPFVFGLTGFLRV
jgi:hypothetical protein